MVLGKQLLCLVRGRLDQTLLQRCRFPDGATGHKRASDGQRPQHVLLDERMTSSQRAAWRFLHYSLDQRRDLAPRRRGALEPAPGDPRRRESKESRREYWVVEVR